MSIKAQLWMVRLAVWVVLAAIGLYLGKFCCHFSGVGDGGLISAAGVSSFAEISFALNTSITLEWFTNQILSFFDGFAKNRLIKYTATVKVAMSDDEIDEGSVRQLLDNINTLKGYFIRDMIMPTRLYRIMGIVVSVFIAACLLFGMPICLKPYVILLPFPALAYYITGLLTGGLMIVRFEDCLRLR